MLWLSTILIGNYGEPKCCGENEVFGCLPEDVIGKLLFTYQTLKIKSFFNSLRVLRTINKDVLTENI